MLIIMTLLTGPVLMLVELVICRSCPKISWQAVLPALVTLTAVGMWVMFALSPSVASFILGWISLGGVAGVLLGWGAFGVWKRISKKKEQGCAGCFGSNRQNPEK